MSWYISESGWNYGTTAIFFLWKECCEICLGIFLETNTGLGGIEGWNYGTAASQFNFQPPLQTPLHPPPNNCKQHFIWEYFFVCFLTPLHPTPNYCKQHFISEFFFFFWHPSSNDCKQQHICGLFVFYFLVQISMDERTVFVSTAICQRMMMMMMKIYLLPLKKNWLYLWNFLPKVGTFVLFISISAIYKQNPQHSFKTGFSAYLINSFIIELILLKKMAPTNILGLRRIFHLPS